jgi:hypothetical protein
MVYAHSPVGMGKSSLYPDGTRQIGLSAPGAVGAVEGNRRSEKIFRR